MSLSSEEGDAQVLRDSVVGCRRRKCLLIARSPKDELGPHNLWRSLLKGLGPPFDMVWVAWHRALNCINIQTSVRAQNSGGWYIGGKQNNSTIHLAQPIHLPIRIHHIEPAPPQQRSEHQPGNRSSLHGSPPAKRV